ncbi:crossover junction endonuclease MUS81 isoform X2 [Callorhinus ursinus]|uniref:Crossover junction endonuclease MUS81 n=1 Tax=Callorhinus ursinus TaxID=34884 RepID=A0A3Q7PK53_CALUR|nr:crossover junction endonuclease MUS81 isoform X1 [Callorhinus ursinus]XP_025734073.1 crossover junction endonuclease MUS81 isoform X1 [Callorhinus ursinus]XP_025734074.1 crossover junction endonuclease MUS81 isoform X1 [Callorhinus ursinus]
MAAPVRLGRKRPLPVCPNPLFVRWLTEWRDEAASRGRRTQFVFQKALRSLRRYPLPLRSGKEAKILQHFGDRLCRMLDQRLQQHKASGGDHAPSSPSGEKSPAREGPLARVQDSSKPIPAQPKAGGSGSYWPARHSGARGVLLLLYREHLNSSGHGFLTKEELLQRCAQKAPTVAPGSTRPWPALRSLLHRNLVLRTHRPARYSLTPEGLELAQKLAEPEGLSSLNVDIGPEQPPGEEPEVPGAASAELGASEGSVQQPPLALGPGEYRVLLCVDVGEAKGAGHRPELLLELQRLRVTHTVRRLHVGDFVWVAQETRPRDPARPGELVLDHIVERKRLDDLCSSIIDGRFHEQKFRLKRCGLGHRVYLVEKHGSADHLSLPESTLLQAVTNTQVIDGFFVKRTADIKESAAYLALLTRGLQRLYQVSRRSCPWALCSPRGSEVSKSPVFQAGPQRPRIGQGLAGAGPRELCPGLSSLFPQGHTLRSRPWGPSGDPESRPGSSPNPLCSLLTFSDFNTGAIKNKAQSVREVFARQLMQVRGVSGEKAAAIVDQYGTPASLLAAYDACATPKEQDMLLSTIKCGQLQRNLGPALSRTFSQLYCCYGPLT